MSETQVKVNATPKTKLAYLFDNDGYYSDTCVVQESPLEPGVWLMPENATTVAPSFNPAYFDKWDANSGVWVQEKKPTSPEDFEGIEIDHYSQSAYCKEMRVLIQALVPAACQTHKIKRGPNMEWMVEVIPAKTEEELEEEAKATVRAKRDALIAKTDFLLAADYPISAEDLEEVKAYRQALRDVPQQAGFPDAVEWPTMPEVKKIA